MKLPRVIGRALELANVVQAVPGSEESSALARAAAPSAEQSAERTPPSIPTSGPVPAVLGHSTTIVSAPPAVDPNDAEVRGRAEKYLGDALHNTPPSFQKFLGAKEEAMQELADVLQGDALVAKAIGMALKSTKLSPADLKTAMQAARSSLEQLKASFATELQTERARQIDGPNREIQNTQAEIASRQNAIAKLNAEITTLQASIDPGRQAIRQAEDELAQGQQIPPSPRPCRMPRNRHSVH